MKKVMIIMVMMIANSSLFVSGMEDIHKLVRKKTVDSKPKETPRSNKGTPRSSLSNSVDQNDQSNIPPLVRKKTVDSKSKETPRSLSGSDSKSKPSIKSLDDLKYLRAEKSDFRDQHDNSRLSKSDGLVKDQKK